jgi:hypothetical protein
VEGEVGLAPGFSGISGIQWKKQRSGSRGGLVGIDPGDDFLQQRVGLIVGHLAGTGGMVAAAAILEQFRLSRQRMAITHTIEDAIKEGGGSVMASKLARDIQSGKYVSGDIKTIAEFSNVFPRVSQPPSQIGTPGSGTMMGRSLSGGAGAALGFGMGGPTGAGVGGAIGALAPEMVSAGMRNYLLSPTGQRNLVPNYSPLASRLTSDQAARNALLLQQANEQRNAFVR